MAANPRSTIDQALSRFDRVSLTRTPTPLDHVPQLSRRLGTNIFVKRDDLTDLALGGDKPRKLEYELAAAQSSGATVLVTCGSAQSNHARLTSAAARKLGLECHVVLSRDRYADMQGNLLSVHLLGAEVLLVEAADHWALETRARSLCDELAQAGETPYYIPVSGTTPLSCLGYVRGGLELADQLHERKLSIDAVYAPFGTGGIFTASLLALRERGLRARCVGVSVNRSLPVCAEHLRYWWQALCELLGREQPIDQQPMELRDEFVGSEYGEATEACLNAILLMARSEGILLDPVYSGKTFSGLVADQQHSRWNSQHNIVLWHSGGVPALFAYHQQIVEYLARH